MMRAWAFYPAFREEKIETEVIQEMKFILRTMPKIYMVIQSKEQEMRKRTTEMWSPDSQIANLIYQVCKALTLCSVGL